MAKRKRGDRKDARLLRDADSMHFLMGMIFPNRSDNEAFIAEDLDISGVEKYLEKKKLQDPNYKYNVFQFMVTTILRVIVLRPKLNRFYANNNYYERNKVTASFIIKKEFNDHSEEGLARLEAEPTWNIDNVHNEIYKQVKFHRGGQSDKTGDTMDILNKVPRFIGKAAMRVFCFLDRHGWIPADMSKGDPYYASVLLSNLGSIKLQAGYHHLSNWGTTSLFCTIGEVREDRSLDENGKMQTKRVLPIGLTIDERIADGYYYAKTMRLVRKIFACPELLEQQFNEEIEY